jgi:addiction module HigA family antidote
MDKARQTSGRGRETSAVRAPASPVARPPRKGARIDPRLEPIIPGEVLAEEFLRPLNVSQNSLARAIEVPPARVNDLVHGRRAITADTAVRLALFFSTSIEFWINLQAQYDARVARDNLHPRLRTRIRPFIAA